MKKKILSKIFTRNNKKGKKDKIYQFGEDIPIDFSRYYKISFYLRNHLEFKKKDYGKKLVINYYSNTFYPKNAYIVFNYTTKKKPKIRILKYNFQFLNGDNTLEFNVPINILQLNFIEIYLSVHENFTSKDVIRFKDIRFEN